ncbi:MAG: LacI family DNA-binding transcriptional regulator [Clostridia bacterium]|nr:LacI family DNA-binding transcriptional regulator [Clostridia bacterium]
MNSTKRVTVKDLARLCGVSTGTIDRALNNRGRIDPETKAKILETADRCGFVKNQYARALSSGRPNLIGVVILNLKNEYFPAVLTGIDAEAHKRGYSTLFSASGYSADEERDCIRRMLSMNVAGIIVCSVQNDVSYYEQIRDAGTPVVAVSNLLGEQIPYVGIDDRSAMRDAAAHILSRGYEKIYYVAPVLSKKGQNIAAQALRYEGFLTAMEQSGVEYEVIDTNDKLQSLTIPSNKRCALLCSSDVYTQRCIAKYRGCDNVGLMGFDNVESLRVLFPDLTTVAYDMGLIGEEAVSLLLDGGGSDKIVPYRIIEGKTI